MKKFVVLLFMACSGCVTYIEPGYHDIDGAARWTSADYSQSSWVEFQSEPGTPVRIRRSNP